MPSYLTTARDSEGKKVTERHEAASADELLGDLRERGYDEIVLHTDDVGAHHGGRDATTSIITARQYLRFRDLPAPLATILFLTTEAYKRGWKVYLMALAGLAIRVALIRRWDFVATLLAAYLLLPVAFALAAAALRGVRPAGRYQKLIAAVSWGRWEEVLARVDLVGGSVSPAEIAFRKAGALAGLGRLEEALRVVEPFGDGRAMPAWLYRSRLGTVYWAAGRREESKVAMEEALELAPDNATLLLDKARSEVWHRRNHRLARELLDQARGHALSDVLQPSAIMVEGLIRLEEGRPREARELLAEALAKTVAFRHTTPLMGSLIDQTHAALALALAAEGNIDEARRHYRLARPRLVALKLDDQLARCEAAIGPP